MKIVHNYPLWIWPFYRMLSKMKTVQTCYMWCVIFEWGVVWCYNTNTSICVSPPSLCINNTLQSFNASLNPEENFYNNHNPFLNFPKRGVPFWFFGLEFVANRFSFFTKNLKLWIDCFSFWWIHILLRMESFYFSTGSSKLLCMK